MTRPQLASTTSEVGAIDSRTAFVAGIRRHDRRLRGLAFRLLGGDRHRMDDAMQEAYLRAYRSMSAFRSDADLGTWLYRITYNACIDELRRGHRRPEPVDVAEPSWDRPSLRPLPDDVVADADTVAGALRALSDDQRATVVLVDGEGLDHATVAALMGVPLGTVASRLARARHAMRTTIGEDR